MTAFNAPPFVIDLTNCQEPQGWIGDPTTSYTLTVSLDGTKQQEITVTFNDADARPQRTLTVKSLSDDPLDAPPFYADHLDLACAVWSFLMEHQEREGHEFLSYCFVADDRDAITLEMPAPEVVR